MSNWALAGGGGRVEAVGEGSFTNVTVVTAAGSANTKGSWTELIASTGFDYHAIQLLVLPNSATAAAHRILVDLAIGAAGSEVVILSNIPVHMAWSDRHPIEASLPLHVPASSRVSARIQSSTASATARVSVLGVGGGFLMPSPYQRISTLGADTTDSGGTTLTSGAIDTKGSYAEVSASTTHPIRQVFILCFGDSAAGSLATQRYQITLAVGAAGSEVDVVDNAYTEAFAIADTLVPWCIGPIPVDIPEGARVAAAVQASAATKLLDVVVLGVG